MEEGAGQIQRIEEKVQQLLKYYAILQKENLRQEKENSRLSKELHTKSEQIINLQQKIDSLRLATPIMDESSKKELEKRIEIYLKEIDRCLELLHS